MISEHEETPQLFTRRFCSFAYHLRKKSAIFFKSPTTRENVCESFICLFVSFFYISHLLKIMLYEYVTAKNLTL